MIQLHIGERYRIHGSLGAGTGGVIYLGEERSTGEKVAIKHFRNAHGNRPAMQEVSAIMGIDHENIVRCIDFFYLGAGELYLVYEYANGGNLRDYLERNGKIDTALALEWTRQVLAGLGYLHGMGLVHCDLKPENILFHRESDESLRVKLGDLGVAHFISQIAGGDRTIAGSPAYMSPERFYDTFSYNSDLYSLGIVLFEMLTGDRPFHGGPADVARCHLREPVNYGKIENPRLKDILSGLLDKDPRYRFQTAKDVQVMVEAMVNRRSSAKVGALKLTKPMASRARNKMYSSIRADFEEVSRFALKLPLDRLHPLTVKGNPVVAMEYSAHLEFLDGFSGESLNHFLPNIGLTVQTLVDGSLVYSTRSRICCIDAASLEERTLVEDCTRVFGMHWVPEKRMVLWADAKSGHAYSPDYKTSVTMPVHNFGLTAHPRIFPDNCYLFSSGPINPCISIFEASGRPVKKLTLDGAVLDMTYGGDSLLIVTLCRDDSGSMTLYRLDKTLEIEKIVVPTGFDSFATSCDSVYFLGRKGEVIVYSDSLVSNVLLQVAKGTQGLYVSPDNRFLYTTAEEEKRTEVVCYENQGEQSPKVKGRKSLK